MIARFSVSDAHLVLHKINCDFFFLVVHLFAVLVSD